MTNKKINFEYAFRLEPKEMIEYFDSKGIKTSENWYEVYEEAHAKAFTVAKMTEADLLKQTQELTSTAIKEGWSKGEFSAKANKLFKENGWSGVKIIRNEDGSERTIELGTPRRIRNIYHSNIASAQSAARYKQQLEDVDIAPYFRYMCIMDGRTRPEHKAMHGKIFRYDDPVWAALYPPNGWGCRCFVNSLTEAELKRYDYTVEKSDGNLREIETIVGGESKKIPAYDFTLGGKEYTLRADAGWGTNIGKHAWGIDVQAWHKIKELPRETKEKFISEMAQNLAKQKFYEQFATKALDLKPKGYEQTVSWLSPQLWQKLYNSDCVPQTPIIVMQDSRAGHIIGETKTLKQKISKKQFIDLYNVINTPDAVYFDNEDESLLYIKKLDKAEIIDNRNVIKVVIKLKRMKKGNPVNYIATAGRVNMDTIAKNKRLKKIE